MDKHQQLKTWISNNREAVGKVVDFDPEQDRLYKFDLTAANTDLAYETIADTTLFSSWINAVLSKNNCRYGIGGYMEHRTIYARSDLFNKEGLEPRRLHLGTDIWGPAGTPVYAPLDGKVHSFQDNNNFGDYGPTIILCHELSGLTLYSLYGHLNRECLEQLTVGQTVSKGTQIALFGDADVNGNWPPHLHFQLMFDMQELTGDYPGVDRFSEKQIWQQNLPDPELILQFEGVDIVASPSLK